MKRLTMLVALTCAATTITFAQKNPKEMKYRRSSLYTIMVPSDKLTGDAKEVVTATFDTLAIPDKYNDHNLKVRHIDLTKIEVTPEEVKAAEEVRRVWVLLRRLSLNQKQAAWVATRRWPRS